MKLKTLKYILPACTALAVMVSSCIKNDVKELGDAGKSFVKILESPENKLFFEPFTGSRNVSLFSLRRDANSSAELNKPVTINLRVDTAAITAYNLDNHEDYEQLPDSLFTLQGTGITKTGNLTYQLALSPGEYAKDFMISLNGSKWDLSKKYAMPFVIENAGGLTASADNSQTLTLISLKNKWDGIYRLKGYHNRSPYNFPYDQEMQMITNGANSLIFYWPLAGSVGHPIGTGPDIANDVNWYGPSIAPVIVFDPVTDVVTNVFNNPPNTTPITRFDGATGSNVSRYDEATKTIIVHWNYNNNPERAFFDTLTYVGPR